MNVKSDLKDYFSEDWLARQPFSKMYFLEIDFFKYCGCCKYIHLAQIQPGQEEIKYTTLWPTWTQDLESTMCLIDKLSIDESIVNFNGRIIFKCYNPQNLPNGVSAYMKQQILPQPTYGLSSHIMAPQPQNRWFFLANLSPQE
jgi:hypothetical protein